MKKDTAFSELLFERAKKVIPGGVNSPVRAFAPYPFFTKYSKGSKLVDVDGKEYIDYCLGYGPLIFGHSHQDVIDAVTEQLRKGTLFGTPTEEEVELAELICKNVPCAEMIRLVSTGTEATMSAIRVARGYTGKQLVVKFEGCYHGAHDSVLVKAGSGATTFGMPDSLGIPGDTTRNTLVIPYNDLEVFEQTLDEQGDNVAAVIVEPVIGNAGVILPQDGFLRKIRELTKEKGVVLIFDEVITGFRLAFGGAQEYFGITPDLATFGKIMGGGFPLAAFAGKKEIMENVAPAGKVYQAGTFSGNPVSVVAGLVTLKKILRKGDSFYSTLKSKRKMICDAVEDFVVDNHFPVQVNSISSMFQFFFTENEVSDYDSAKKADKVKFMIYHKKLLENGIFVPPSQFETCFISYEHSREDIEKTVDTFEESIKYALL